MVMHVFDSIADCRHEIASLGPVNETLGGLDTNAAALLRDCGVTRILQPEEYGGFATHPGDFAEAVMQIAALDSAAGWVAGTIGATAWELAMAPRRVRDDVWGVDGDSWVSSALQPTGVLQQAVDGYLLTGRWRAVTAIDHCDWVLLGARLSAGAQPATRRLVHVLVPRSDLRIVDDAPDTVGLIGAGSRDVTVTDAAVPGYRVLDHNGIANGSTARRLRLPNPTYRIPASATFPLGAAAAIVGMAEGAVASHRQADDLAPGLRGSHAALLEIAAQLFTMSLEQRRVDAAARARVRARRDTAVRAAVGSLDELLSRAGSNAMRRSSPLQRFWRDAHMATAYLGEAITARWTTALTVAPTAPGAARRRTGVLSSV